MWSLLSHRCSTNWWHLTTLVGLASTCSSSKMHNAQRTLHNAQSADLPSHLSTQHSPLNTGLNPCVELNLRTTMGAITSVLGDKVLAPATTGTFTIEQRSSTSIPWRELQEPVFEKGRLSSGALCLTTPSPTALYRAVLWSN